MKTFFGRLGVEGSNFVDQLAACVVGGRDGGSMTRKGMVNEHLLQIISETTQVNISRRVSRFNLQLRDRQEGSGEGGMTDPNRCLGMELGCGLGFGIEIKTRAYMKREGKRQQMESR